MLIGGAVMLSGVAIGTYVPYKWAFWLAAFLVVSGLVVITAAVIFIAISAMSGQKRQ